MLTPTQADAAIAARLPLLPAEACALERAAGRVLRAAVYADLDQPPFDRVAMDGIAVAQVELERGRRSFRIAGVVAAGAPPPALPTLDACLEVMTGAVLPAGTDTVIPVEELEVEAGRATLRTGARAVPFGNVHRRATDARAGATLLDAGVQLRGPELAIAASAGAISVSVSREPRISVVSTGDELVPPAVRPQPWQIRRSNAFGIDAVLRARGYSLLDDAHVGDEPGKIRALLGERLERDDVVILSGGVSAGRFDHVPAALAALGVEQVFHRVAQRPGKPLWFGTRGDGRVVFALPGNPVSTLVCLVRYVVPAIARMLGATPTPPACAPLLEGFEAKHSLTVFLPVDRRDGGSAPGFVPHPTHGSGDFVALAGTAGFVELVPETRWEPGSLAPLYTW